ncbi:MAG: cytochrome c3 family protein [Bdellovibrionales bacterium]|nr:cytochrome c3 family protein [Bdellovibrionales bacterium]
MTNKVIGAAVVVGLLAGLSGVIYLLSTNSVTIGYNKGYQPDQPIPFSHELHAGQNKIDCKYCHVSVEVSRHSSVPSLNICMNCHLTVGLDKPNIMKLHEANSSGQSIPWQKVHLLPDHVKFNHSAHIAAGKVCQDCHGPVETMPVVYQYNDLSMGWCVSCHRQPENNAPTECSTCHY